MSTPVKPLPPANRILAAGWAEQEHASHQSRLALMRPLVNSSAPACSRVKIKRLKQKVATEMENERIDRENRILLQRMSHIQCRPSPALPPPTAPTPAAALAQAKQRSLNSGVRAREQERIAEENLALVARLKRGRGYQEQLDLERHERDYANLKQAGQRARKPPAALPAPKYGATHAGSHSDRASSSGGGGGLGKSASQSTGLTAMLGALQQRSGSSPGHARPASQAMSASASMGALSLHGALSGLGSANASGNGRTRGSLRPLSEWHDEYGAVEPISAQSFPSFTPRSAEASSKLTVPVKQDASAQIDGRGVVVSLDELTVDPDRAALTASVSGSLDPALLHCFLFRTFEAASQQRDYVTVPYAIVEALPECREEPSLLQADQRALLAECLFNRLRFHEGKLAFNPSHALRRDGSVAALSSARRRGDEGQEGDSDSARGPAGLLQQHQQQQHQLHPGALWDAIGSDGRVRPATTAETDEWDRAVAAGGRRDGTSSPDLEHSPRGGSGGGGGAVAGRKRRPAHGASTPSKSGASGAPTLLTASGALPAALSPLPKPLRLIGRHHLSTTLATVVRAGALAPGAQSTIQAARADRQKKMAYKQLLHERSRSNSPARAASPARRTAATQRPNLAKTRAAPATPTRQIQSEQQTQPEQQQPQHQSDSEPPPPLPHTEPAEPAQAQPAQAEPPQAEPPQAQPSQAQSSQAEPPHAEPSHAEPSQAEPSQAEPPQAEHVPPEPEQKEQS